MADIVLFGATGYTGRLTAKALAAREADFAIAGRDGSRLQALASQTGGPRTHAVTVGDVEGLVTALEGAKVLVTCVGPFVELGETAVEAAIRAGVHYMDSTGEGVFIDRLLSDYQARARAAGVALAPALGFDEVPGDLAVTIASEGMEGPEVVLTYALPTQASTGTLKSALSIVGTKGPWIEGGEEVQVGVGQHSRWAPMPEPLGPRLSTSFPLAEGRLAPLHVELRGFKTLVTVGRGQELALRNILPLFRPALAWSPVRETVRFALDKIATNDGPGDEERADGRWTILAEATGARGAWRNVVLQGTDVYGLTAEMLAAGAMGMARDGFDRSGVIAPVEALGREGAEKELRDLDVTFRVVD